MQQIVNIKYKPLFTQKPRYFILMGGRSAGRSTAGAQFGVSKLRSDEYFRCAAMRYVLSDVRNSIFQDLIDHIENTGIPEAFTIRENPKLSIEFGDNRIDALGFKKSSGEQKAKLKSLANYTTVIIEEADETSEDDFMQLDDTLRTIKGDITIILLLNPPHKKHWMIKRWFNLVQAKDEEGNDIEGFYMPELKESVKHNTVFIHTTFRDNIQNINPATVENFMAYKVRRPDHYYNMIEGLVSEGARGRIFKTWNIIPDDEFEALPYETIYGLDFGFTNDPTVLIAIKMHNDKVWCRELIHEAGLTNQRISKRLTDLGVAKTAKIIADSAEPKSIEEINTDGWNVLPAEKGPDSIKAGIDMLLDKEVFYTESSEHVAIEQQEYKWALDRNKEPTNNPIDAFNHCMDAIRYPVFTLSRTKEEFIGFV